MSEDIYYQKYIKYKNKYLKLQNGGDNPFDENFIYISGPVSFYIVKLPKYDKTIYFFGDFHWSWENMCESQGKTRPIDIIKACDKKPNCIFIATFIKECINAHIFNSENKIGEYIDIFLEQEYPFHREDRKMEKYDRYNLDLSTPTRKHNDRDVTYGPLEYIVESYAECIRVKEKCPNPELVRIHGIDTRSKSNKPQMMEIFFDLFRPIIKEFDHQIKVNQERLVNSIIKYEFIFSIYSHLSKMLSAARKITEQILPVDEHDKFTSLSQADVADLSSEHDFKEPDLSKIELSKDLIIQNIVDLLLDKKIIKQLKNCDEYIENKILEYFHNEYDKNIFEKFKRFYYITLNHENSILKNGKSFVENFNYLKTIDKTNMSNIDLQTVDIVYNYTQDMVVRTMFIRTFLMDILTMYVDIYALGRLFRKFSDGSIVNKAVFYTGAYHTNRYLGFIDFLARDDAKVGKIILSKNLKFLNETICPCGCGQKLGKDINRCIQIYKPTLNLTLDKLINFNV